MKLQQEIECYLNRSYFIEDLSFVCKYSHIYSSRTTDDTQLLITLLEPIRNSLAPQILSYLTYFLLGQWYQIIFLSHIKEHPNNARWPPALLGLPVRRGVAAERTPVLFCCLLLFLSPCLWLTIKLGGSCAPHSSGPVIK